MLTSGLITLIVTSSCSPGDWDDVRKHKTSSGHLMPWCSLGEVYSWAKSSWKSVVGVSLVSALTSSASSGSSHSLPVCFSSLPVPTKVWKCYSVQHLFIDIPMLPVRRCCPVVKVPKHGQVSWLYWLQQDLLTKATQKSMQGFWAAAICAKIPHFDHPVTVSQLLSQTVQEFSLESSTSLVLISLRAFKGCPWALYSWQRWAAWHQFHVSTWLFLMEQTSIPTSPFRVTQLKKWSECQ